MAAEAFSVSPRILWGNVASAVNGAATMLARARPGLSAAAYAFTTRLLSTPPLTATADHASGTFRRHTCCLIYQAGAPDAPRTLCGDCVLAG
jgi:ferric iron reductase protein FhuF